MYRKFQVVIPMDGVIMKQLQLCDEIGNKALVDFVRGVLGTIAVNEHFRSHIVAVKNISLEILIPRNHRGCDKIVEVENTILRHIFSFINAHHKFKYMKMFANVDFDIKIVRKDLKNLQGKNQNPADHRKVYEMLEHNVNTIKKHISNYIKAQDTLLILVVHKHFKLEIPFIFKSMLCHNNIPVLYHYTMKKKSSARGTINKFIVIAS